MMDEKYQRSKQNSCDWGHFDDMGLMTGHEFRLSCQHFLSIR